MRQGCYKRVLGARLGDRVQGRIGRPHTVSGFSVCEQCPVCQAHMLRCMCYFWAHCKGSTCRCGFPPFLVGCNLHSWRWCPLALEHPGVVYWLLRRSCTGYCSAIVCWLPVTTCEAALIKGHGLQGQGFGSQGQGQVVKHHVCTQHGSRGWQHAQLFAALPAQRCMMSA